MPVTTPRVVTTFETEAIAMFPVDHVTSAVTSFVELSLYVAVAFICTVSPLTTVGLAGVSEAAHAAEVFVERHCAAGSAPDAVAWEQLKALLQDLAAVSGAAVR